MPNGPRTGEVGPGDLVAERELITMWGDPLRIPHPEELVHLQLRRFAGCPVCNLHLRAMVQRQSELEAAGIRPVVVFHSTAEELRKHESDLPFPVVPDPDKALYVEFGVEASPRALLNPRVWLPTFRALLGALRATIRRERAAPPTAPRGGKLGLPADFLIASDGRVLACKFGTHAYDQWSVDDLLAAARTGAGDKGAVALGRP
jgi:alkyl-hydroperoxide reductase/thiol specific antioxidant family protein